MNSDLATVEGYGSAEARENLLQALERAVSALEGVEARGMVSPDDGRTVAAGLRLALMALSTLAGECRLALPYAPMRPIQDQHGTRWCCTHNPEHCGSNR